jgi:hypothetical protein
LKQAQSALVSTFETIRGAKKRAQKTRPRKEAQEYPRMDVRKGIRRRHKPSDKDQTGAQSLLEVNTRSSPSDKKPIVGPGRTRIRTPP